jgi:hypothetical protein
MMTYKNKGGECQAVELEKNTILCDKVCQWFSPGTPVSSTNKTDCHYITEILLKLALNTINQTKALFL